ncbi:GntR family transcriptional regulator [Granulosicoccus sp. 3-233]|uniref:GntR family transcriptional regulator n=1 Tax=Granulosicoccus sp. 3-233 TaxID=3417969 RepID=UPI003D347E31
MTSIREQLEQAILLGEFSSGSHLDETQLASRFNVSRTPIREALKQLVASGLLEHRPNRGVFVRTPSVQELLEMFEVMAELEALCVKLAARRSRKADMQSLQNLADACEQAMESGDCDRYYHANERLHNELYRLSGNRFLEQQAAALHRRLQPYRRLQLRVPYRMRQSMNEHRIIVDAVCQGQAEVAADAIRSHIAIQGEKFNDLVADLSALNTGS